MFPCTQTKMHPRSLIPCFCTHLSCSHTSCTSTQASPTAHFPSTTSIHLHQGLSRPWLGPACQGARPVSSSCLCPGQAPSRASPSLRPASQAVGSGPAPWPPGPGPRGPGHRALGPGATTTNLVTLLEWIPTLMFNHHILHITKTNNKQVNK